ncbi:hypothetical protein BGZ83_008400 [Gryganskiella cystojenkinii]|nr:hypothetical protein BGZ83_008400 [Gryganskiella cystojenkinii]
MANLSESCCNTPATHTVWQNQGELKNLSFSGRENKTYRTGPKTATIGIIGIYDVFGYHPTTHQFYDRLAQAHGGFQVSVPHCFQQSGLDSLPAEFLGDGAKMVSWIGANGSYGAPAHLDDLILAAVEDLKQDGCTDFVIYGQCWGAMIALAAAADERMTFLAAGGPHPSRMTIELMNATRCPVILLPASDDADMVALVAAVNERKFNVKSEHHRFDTVNHGWTGARGDWTNDEQRRCGELAIHLLANFTTKVVETHRASKVEA